MRPYRILVLLTLAVTMSVATACQKQIPPPDNAIEEPAELRAAIDARLSQVDDARFKDLVLDYFGERERVKVRQLILVKQPDMLRVQTRLPGTDEIMSLLVTDGERFAMHERETNEYYTGVPTPRNINRILPVDLSARDVVRVMLGGAPWDRFDRGVGEPDLSWNSQTGRYLYSRETSSGGRLDMEVRHTDYAVITVVERDPSGEATYEYTTEDWSRHGELSLPDYRRFVWPARDLDFSLDVGDTQLDVNLQDALFRLPPPPGSTIIDVDGGDEAGR
jgi:outer membrane lipoprotein-sorting protein